MIDDLRGFIQAVEEVGECRVVEDADWDIELGHIAEAVGVMPESPMLLFDSIKDYPKGFRVLANMFTTPRRFALALGFPKTFTKKELVNHYRQKLKEGIKPVLPVEVESGPVKENVLTGDKVDLFKFPVPKWHTLDGGRYIGTGDNIIMRDPEKGWVNVGVYRVQIHDKDTATIWMSPGKHGRIIRQKYWDKGQACPVVATCGQEPLLFLTGSLGLPWGSYEYEYAGWLRQKPIEVTRGVITDLPIPASAEIALEGEILPPEIETREEGPFGEWTGYYASGSRLEPAFKVKAILHRNDPIILGCPPAMNDAAQAGGNIRTAGLLWNELEGIVPGIVGVWALEEARGLHIPVISIKQMYPGHAKQVALAVASSRTAGYHTGRFIIIVDDDIDPFDTSDVLWALATRCDPASSIDIVRGCWSTPLDTIISPQRRELEDFTNSRALILACKPYHWREQFPPSFKLSQQEAKRIREKWEWLFR